MSDAHDDDHDHGSSPLDRTFAVMLAELEDRATELAQQHDRLAKEMQAVDDELERIDTVRSAMVGRPKPAKRSYTKRAGAGGNASAKNGNHERVLALLRERGEPVPSREVADGIGVGVTAIGPLMGGMVRRGEVAVEGKPGERTYRLA